MTTTATRGCLGNGNAVSKRMICLVMPMAELAMALEKKGEDAKDLVAIVGEEGFPTKVWLGIFFFFFFLWLDTRLA